MSECAAESRTAGPVTAAVIDDAIRRAEARRQIRTGREEPARTLLPEAVFGSPDSWERGFFASAGAIAMLSGLGRLLGVDATMVGPAASVVCVTGALGAALWMAGAGRSTRGRRTVRAALITGLTALALTTIAAVAGFAG